MDAEILILEFTPKLKYFKNHLNDIISICFIADNYSIKKEDVEKSIVNKEKIIIPFKEAKNKTIKCSLIKNNNIIGKGEFIPVEGLKWYTLDDTKNSTSIESLITASTSNTNIKSGENLKNKKNNMNSNVFCNSPDFTNTHYNNYENNYFSSKNILNKVNNSAISSIIKIKLSIKLSYKKVKNSINMNHYDIKIKNNNYTKELTINSSKEEDFFFNKKDDIFLEDDLTIVNTEINSTTNRKNKMNTTISKRHYKNYSKHSFPSRILFSKNKININKNQIIFTPNSFNPNNNNLMNSLNSKTIANSVNNSKAMSPKIPKLKNSIINTKRLFNEDKRTKTSNGFYIVKKEEEKENEQEKINSYENFEDEILDQNYKEHLKNDEILKVNISRNNSYYSFIQNNTYNNNKTNTNINEDLNKNIIYTDNKNFISSSSRPKNYDLNNKGVLRNIFPTDITNNLENYFLMINNTNYDERDKDKPNKFVFKQNNKIRDIILTDTHKNFEALKKDFFLLYPNNYSNKIKDDEGLLEIQLIIENALALQYEHQKEYIKLFKLVNSNKNIINNYQKKYVSLVKKMNKLQTKKLCQKLTDSKKDLYNENINNFIKIRKKIMNTGELEIWKKMMENTKSISLNSNKSKLIDVFIRICDKNENNLNILSMKFYKNLKNKNININAFNKQQKNLYLSSKNVINIKKKTDLVIPTNIETNKNLYNLTYNHSKEKSKHKNIKISETKLNIYNQNKINNNIKVNINNMVNDSISFGNNHNNSNVGKINKYKKKSSSINSKAYNKKKC